jgi:hypothetical protein
MNNTFMPNTERFLKSLDVVIPMGYRDNQHAFFGAPRVVGIAIAAQSFRANGNTLRGMSDDARGLVGDARKGFDWTLNKLRQAQADDGFLPW